MKGVIINCSVQQKCMRLRAHTPLTLYVTVTLIRLPELITVLIASVDRASLTLEACILEQFYILGCIKEALVFGCFTLLL